MADEYRTLVRNLHSAVERWVTIEEYADQGLALQGYYPVKPREPAPPIVVQAEVASVEEALAAARSVVGSDPVPEHVQAIVDAAVEEVAFDMEMDAAGL